MKYNVKALHEERAKCVADMEVIVDKAMAEKRSMSTDETTEWGKLNKRVDELKAQADILETQEARSREMAEKQFKREEEAKGTDDKKTAEEVRSQVFEKYLRFGMAELNGEERSLMQKGYANLEQRAQGTGSGAAGGYLIPRGFSGELDIALKAYGGMLEAARSWNTSDGATVDWPTFDDTGVTGYILGEAADAAAGATDAAFGQKTLGGFTYTSGLLKVNNQLLQDSAFDLSGILSEALATRLGRIMNTHMTTGDGTAKPRGITLDATAVAAGAAAAITFDDMINLLHSVNPAYRKSPNSRFMFSDGVLAVLRKLKDSEGRYIWQLGNISTGTPDTILGKQYIINDDMAATVATTNKTALFGDMARYIIRRIQGVVIRRLEERFADTNQTAFVGFMRVDGRLLNAAAVKCLTQP